MKKAESKYFNQDKKKGLETALFVCFSVCVGIGFLFYCFTKATDADYLWHIRLAEDILKARALPTVDTYSWRSMEMGYTEFAHSWLGSVILGSMIKAIASTGCNLMFSGRLFSLFWYLVCVLIVRHTFYKERVTWTYTLACVYIAQTYSLIRIQNLSNILFVLMLCVLYKSKKPWQLFWLPILTILCANIHGGIAIIFVGVQLVYTIWQEIPKFRIGAFEHKPVQEYKMKSAYALASFLSVLAIRINPYGARLYTYFLHVENDAFSTKYVFEWMPISVKGLDYILIIVLLALPLLQRRRVNILRYGLVLGFFILSCKYRRFAGYAIIGSMPLLAEYGELFCVETEGRLKKVLLGIRKIILTAAVPVLLFMIAWWSWMIQYATVSEDASFGVLQLNAEEITYLKTAGYQRPFCDYNCGADLIYIGVKPFVDSRADLYVGGELGDMADLITQTKPREALDEIMDKYAFDATITPVNRSYGFQNYMSAKDNWVLDYKGEHIIVYKYVGN